MSKLFERDRQIAITRILQALDDGEITVDQAKEEISKATRKRSLWWSILDMLDKRETRKARGL